MQLNGSEIIAECLIEQGVDTVFGYPGGAVLNIYDALYKYSDRITHILSAHEQGASHRHYKMGPYACFLAAELALEPDQAAKHSGDKNPEY